MSGIARLWAIRALHNRHVSCGLLTLAVVVSAWLYATSELEVAGELGFPLDDSWIHLQFAENLARDGQLAFNPGDWSAGSTAPLWTALLAIPIAMGLDPIVSAKCLGTLLAVVAACLCRSLTTEITGSRMAGLVAGAATALSPRMVWGSVSGMEVPLYVALVLGAALVYTKAPDRFAWLWGLLFGLSGAARPETFLLFFALVAHRALGAPAADRARLRATLIRAVLPFAMVVLAYAAVNYIGDGRPFPTTLAAKSEGRGLVEGLAAARVGEVARSLSVGPLLALNTFLRFLFDQSALLTLFVLPGALSLTGFFGPRHPRGVIVLLIAVLAPVILGAVAPSLAVPQQDGRYVAHGIVFTFVVAAAGASAMARFVSAPTVVWIVVAVAIGRLLSQDLQYADRHARMVQNISQMHVALGMWLRDHTGADAVVAVNDIGAIARTSRRRVLDLEGIVTPDVIPYKRRGHLIEFLELKRPTYLVIFREWYPELARRTELFQEVHRVTVPRVSAAHDSMVVYQTPWTGQGAGREVP